MCSGGDGFAIVFKLESVSTGTFTPSISSVKQVGKSLGYSGLTNCLAIEFDTWFNSELYDPQQVTSYMHTSLSMCVFACFISSGENHEMFPLSPCMCSYVDFG